MNKIIMAACACACIASGIASASSRATYLGFGFDGNTYLGIGHYFGNYDIGISASINKTKYKKIPTALKKRALTYRPTLVACGR